MDYVVLTKGVPDFREGKVAFKEDNTLDRGSTPTVMNPNDRYALEAALQAKVKYGGTVKVLSMGPPPYKTILEEAMEVYADSCTLLSDPRMAAADTLATAETLKAGIDKIGGADVVFAGFKTADGETGQTGPQAAWKMDFPLYTHVVGFELDPDAHTCRIRRISYDYLEELEGPLPAFVVTDPAFEPSYRRASERLKLKDLRAETTARLADFDDHFSQFNADDLDVDLDKIGLNGSPTIVREVEPIPKAPAEREAEMLDASPESLERAVEVIAEARGAA